MKKEQSRQGFRDGMKRGRKQKLGSNGWIENVDESKRFIVIDE